MINTRRAKLGYFRAVSQAAKKVLVCFLGKDLKKMTAESYSEEFYPHVVQCLGWSIGYTGNRMGSMQDNAPYYKTVTTTSFLRAHGVEITIWPAFSPKI